MKHLQAIAELGPLLKSFGIRNVVICPGSRNAPLIQLFTSDPYFQCYSIVDERSAGYIALGMARQLKETVVVLTTSGTAVLNMAPAVAEAYYQRIPLLVMTADRPLEKIGQFNNQWLDQQAPYYAFSKGYYQIPLTVKYEEDLARVIQGTWQLIDSAFSVPAGPVHLNIPVEEPLYEQLPPALGKHAYPGSLAGDDLPSAGPGTIEAGARILILAGMGTYDPHLSEQLSRLVKSSQTVVIAENISNLPGEDFIVHPDLVMAARGEEELKDLKPDLVFSFGGQVVSKRLKLFLQAIPELKHEEISGNVEEWLELLAGKISGEQDPLKTNRYLEAWKKEEERTMKQVEKKVNQLDFGSLQVIQTLLSAVPSGSVIHLGNSSTIRYSQMLPHRADLSYFSNRGTSGIDGCVSSAVGAAMVSEELHLLLVGDLSFVYDSNALWNEQFPGNLKVVVLNDRGGGIFRLLKGPSQMDFFEKYSVTRHPVSPEALARAFGRDARRVTNRTELEELLPGFLTEESSLSVLEIEISGTENSRIFAEFYDFKS